MLTFTTTSPLCGFSGPAQVWLLALSGRRRWAYVELDGNGVWVREDCVTEVVRGSGQPRQNDPLLGSS